MERVILTGSSGRIGRAINRTLSEIYQVVGVDQSPASATQLVGDIGNAELMGRLIESADILVHCAALHAPHVGLVPDREFERVNVEATQQLAEIARARGVRRFIFTSTTALYGNAIVPGSCAWIDEDVCPEPRTVYHHTKLAAERILERLSCPSFQVRVIRMSRCFPEPAPLMAAYRLHRGVDARDVAEAHRLAIMHSGPAFRCFVVSARTPFRVEDCPLLAENATAVINVRAPELASAFAARDWGLPKKIDRIYDSTRAQHELGWQPRFAFDEILADLDRSSPEVLLP